MNYSTLISLEDSREFTLLVKAVRENKYSLRPPCAQETKIWIFSRKFPRLPLVPFLGWETLRIRKRHRFHFSRTLQRSQNQDLLLLSSSSIYSRDVGGVCHDQGTPLEIKILGS